MSSTISEKVKNEILKQKQKRELKKPVDPPERIVQEGVDPTKQNIDIKKCSKATQLKKALFYDWKRENLSRTALMNFIFFSMVIITWLVMLPVIIWVIVNAIQKGQEIPTGLIAAFFTWTTTLVGIGGFQYTAGKKIMNGGTNE